MEILGLEKVSLVDYEGLICATVFTGGCNFLCPFCHNSGIVKKQFSRIDEREVLEYLEKRKGLLDAVTISGGEPTLQPDLEDFIVKVRALGYKVKLDTNGAMPDVVERLLNKGLIDHVAMDIKNNFDDYGKITGLKNPPVENVKKTLQLLSGKVSYELRTTLVREFHTQKNIEKLAEDLAGQKVLFLQKFEDSGALVGGVPLSPVPIDEAEKYKQILEKTIDKVYLRGY